MDQGTRLRPVDDVLIEELDGELLLLRPGRSDVLHLDAVASNVWRLIAVAPTEDELVLTLAEAYGTAADTVRTDVRDALDVLRAHDLLA